MRKLTLIAFVVLTLVLLSSLAVNAYIYPKAKHLYHDLIISSLDLYEVPPTSVDTSSSKPMLLFYGDSRAAAWPQPESLTNAIIVNRGIPGQTTAQAQRRFQQLAGHLKPDVIVIQIGVNDLKNIPLLPEHRDAITQNCIANISLLLAQAQALSPRVILTTIFPLGDVPMERRLFWSDDVAVAIREVNAWMGTLGNERVTVLDSVRILEGPDGSVAHSFQDDLLHINPTGYAALNAELIRHLELNSTEH